jgi:hypothetical protein
MSFRPLTTRRRAGHAAPARIGVLFASALVVVTMGLPASAFAQSKDQTIGHITEPDGRKIDFAAQSDPNGSNPAGNAKINFRPDENVSEFFDVTCLVTLGNKSVISAVLDHVSPPSFQTAVQGIVIWANDNDALGTPDTYDYVLTGTPPPCLVPVLAFTPVVRGDITVIDVP